MRKFTLVLTLATIPVLGCADKPQTSRPSSPPNQDVEAKPHSIDSEDEAIDTFQRLWRDSLAMHLTDRQRQYTDHLVTKVRSGKEVSARLQSLQECLRRVDGTLMEEERKTLILHGNISDLEGPGSCWTVETHGGFGNELCAYVDTRGELIFVWIVPEG